MNKDHMKGRAERAKGKFKEVAGKAIGDEHLVIEGKVDQVAGKTQAKYGDTKEKAKDLAGKARKRRLAPHEYQGGTTALSNLGMFGIKNFDAVINPPHATILAVGTGEERAIVKNGKIEIAHIMSVTLSCDHRAVDGALGAELIGAFKALIENPVMMVV